MNRYFTVLALLLLLTGFSPVAAQAQPAALAATTATQSPPPPADPAQVKALVQTLNDPVARAKLIDQLNLLAQQQTAQKAAAAEPVGTRVLKFLSAKVAEGGEEFGALEHAFVGLPSAERWFGHQLSNPDKRARWAELAGSLAAVLAAGAVAFGLIYLGLRGPRRAIERRPVARGLARVLFGAVCLVFRLIPIGVFAAVSYALLSVIGPPALVTLATLTIINAILLVLIAIAASHFLLAPGAPNLRLIPVRDKPAMFMHRWIRRIGAILALGWFGIAALQLFGLPHVAAHAAQKILGLVILIILVSLVIAKRRGVARWIRGDGNANASPSAFWSVRIWLSEVWHLLAAAYLIVIFAIWAFDIEEGFEFVLRGTLISLLVIAGARLIVVSVERAVARGVSLSRDTKGRFPRLQERADRYLPIIRASASVIIWLGALIALVEVWGLDSLGWFGTQAGRALVTKLFSIAFVLVSAVIAWEFVSALIESYLVGAVQDGTPVERSQRVRTLLPLIRNAFLIFLIVVVILIVLSEIGLNIAPLLAGAGVVGLAIGFGAQTLVKDVITGVFILFENTIAVGDVVDVGGGHSGLVEHFSIRTVKLRDSSGGVHTVPFSVVTSVNNMTKDFAYYVFNIKVDYAQDTDRVVEVVTALGKELQGDMAFCDMILAPIEIIGVDSFGSDAAVLQARFKTRPIKQWSVGREFNRRMKKRFYELKIPLTFPQSMVLLPNGNPGIAPDADTAAAATSPTPVPDSPSAAQASQAPASKG